VPAAREKRGIAMSGLLLKILSAWFNVSANNGYKTSIHRGGKEEYNELVVAYCIVLREMKRVSIRKPQKRA